ncbi:hypothetical protein WJX74_007432 [Apatococcus lobatus]|uniref:Transaldolase n=1 Tax=Apatococcus lobatus TaxID=904363 RepID=A0AAW1SH52_9CHLO
MYSLPSPSGRLSQTSVRPGAACKNLCRALRARRPARQATLTKAAAATKFETTEVKSPQQAGTHESENQLQALKLISKVVADTGDIELIKKYKPVDSTTNPSLVYKAVQMPQYAHFLQEAKTEEKGMPEPGNPYGKIADRLAVNMGIEILENIPGRVSTEVDAQLSFDTRKTIDKALTLVDKYSEKGIDTSRIYIKIASTWAGIRAAEELQKQGIDCNLTLLFSFAQAAACADAGAALISPFVGRILDWYKKAEGRDFWGAEDPGVKSVTNIYKYYKAFGYKTIVMAASFRNIGEIQELAGCDNITISPNLLGELEANKDPLPQKLYSSMGGYTGKQLDLSARNQLLFDQMHGSEPMAVDKLQEGIDGFAKDQVNLFNLLAKLDEAGHGK